MTDLLEVLLNVFWLLVAIAAFLSWRTQSGGRRPARRGGTRPARTLALACALSLLFPVISLTDDLHQVQAVMEDSSRSVMKSRDLAQGCLRTGKVPFHAVLTAAFGSTAVPHVPASGFVPLAGCGLCLLLTRQSEGRSPPFTD